MCTVQLRAAKRSLSTCTRRGDFQCLDGQCISRRHRCDGKVDCNDGSDEQIDCKRRRKRSSCFSFQYQCANGLCISSWRKCNGNNDCGDYSDEWMCSTPATCPFDRRFQCANGECVPQSYRCDGFADCNDYSDEWSCPTTSAPCPYYRFQCSNGRCVSRSYQCNGDNNCGDNSDEWSCPTTSALYCSHNFRCHNGGCVPQSYVCDGDNDCGDNSDEENCRKERLCRRLDSKIKSILGHKELSVGATIGLAFAVGIVVFLVVVGTMITLYVRAKNQRRRQLRVSMTTTTSGSSRVVFAPSHARTIRMGPQGRQPYAAAPHAGGESALPTYEEVMERSSGEPSGRVESSEEQATAFVQREGHNL
ncbi:low-density lipoprotein receptor-related protein 4-like isoform X1 [Oscarella lobularis]|uniref:low-density lipoprotein receptor-related protein 4-like isoform X1 n=1 Tax=Oscarella lobularis TaxID=121494 RepID=UPI003314353D